MIAIRLRNIFGKNRSKVKFKVQWLTLMVKVKIQKSTFDTQAKFLYRNPKLRPKEDKNVQGSQNNLDNP